MPEYSLSDFFAVDPAATKTQIAAASAASLGAGYYATYKWLADDPAKMNSVLVSAPVLGVLLDNPNGFIGSVSSEIVGGLLGMLFGSSFRKGATAGAVSSLLLQLYVAAKKTA